jgi:pyridoxamine 5'-phosphate oxidase
MVTGDRDFGDLRREYRRETLDETRLPDDPVILLATWLEEAESSGVMDPTAMTLSTVGSDGTPSSRMVLLKKIEAGKLLFFTSLNSRKAQDITRNAAVAAHFYWPEMERQIKISGSIRKVPQEVADGYFQSRPLESQISTWISPQSEVIPGRKFLEDAFEAKRQEFKEKDPIPTPPHWGGFAISPERMEYWQGGKHRLHDRIEYRMKAGRWKRVRLAP